MNSSKQNFFSLAKHVGIIMDGNRRWAKLNGLKNIFTSVCPLKIVIQKPKHPIGCSDRF